MLFKCLFPSSGSGCINIFGSPNNKKSNHLSNFTRHQLHLDLKILIVIIKGKGRNYLRELKFLGKKTIIQVTDKLKKGQNVSECLPCFSLFEMIILRFSIQAK